MIPPVGVAIACGNTRAYGVKTGTVEHHHRLLRWSLHEFILVRTQTSMESLHETGIKVTTDYIRPVWTQTGTNSDWYESNKWLHETCTIIQRLLCTCLKRKSQTSLKSVCDYMGKTAEPVWLIRVGSAPGMSQTGLRWFFEPVSCKQKQGFVWRPIWSRTGLSSYRSHVITPNWH